MAMTFPGPVVAGRWRLGPRLGRGAQAETFLAHDDQGTVEVVVKRVQLRHGWKSFELYEREARVLGALRHPGIPKLLAAFEEPPGTFNLVMERMPGEDLRAVATRRGLSGAELRDVLIRTLEILDYLHGRAPPVIHRDLKPANLVRSPRGGVALVDFGGVLEAARERGGSTMIGTFGYMAPEQLHGQVTPASDLYALGATIVALAGGVEPEDVPRKGLRMDLARHLPGLDPGLRATLDALTEPDPDRRPQRARDVIALLAKTPAPPQIARAIATIATPAPPRRRLLGFVPEPLGTLLRLFILMCAAMGWLGLQAAQLTVRVIGRLGGKRARAVTGDLSEMLVEGRDGFGGLIRGCLPGAGTKQLPPGS